MASTVTDPIAEALKTTIEGISSLTIKVYKWPPKSGDLDTGVAPAAVIWSSPRSAGPTPTRPRTTLAENDWNYTFPVTFYFDLGDASFSQGQAVEAIEAFIKAIDANQDLTGTCQEAKAMADQPEYFEGEAKPIIRWPTRVQILKFVTS
jgi:hypothetical protein